MKATLLKDEHDTLCITIQLVCDDLKLDPTQETSLLTVHVIRIMDQSCKMARDTLCFGIHRSFVIACSHYENIDLATMS